MMGKTDHLPRCGEWMPQAKERCARMKGHAGSTNRHGQFSADHRTRYCLDNTYRMKIGREVDPFVFRGGEWVLR